MNTHHLEQHYQLHWGDPARKEVFEVDDREIAVLTWLADQTNEGVTLYATVGMSLWPTSAGESHRAEVILGLEPPRPGATEALAALAAYPFHSRTALDHGDTLDLSSPLWPGAGFTTWLVTRPSDEVLPVLEHGVDVHVEFLVAVPVFPSEVERKRREGVMGLRAHWELFSVDFWNPDRQDLLR